MVKKEIPTQRMILPFDHRGSFAKSLLGYEGVLTPYKKRKVTYLKKIVYDAFLDVFNKTKNKRHFGILVDEEYGSHIAKYAKQEGVTLCMPAEKSGQSKFMFDYGNKFGKHIKEFEPDFVKVLVRYNPHGNRKSNKLQLKRLSRLSQFCLKNNYKFLFELLVPPTKKELKSVDGIKEVYDHKIRAIDTALALRQISKVLHVDGWKLEGMDTKKAWKDCIASIKAGINPDDFFIIVLGRGESKANVDKWLKTAASFDEVTGFAVGRTIFQEPLENYLKGDHDREKAVNQISKNFKYFVNLWKKAKGYNFR